MTEKNAMKRRRTPRELLTLFLPSILIVAAGFAIAYQFVEPAPPKRITIATGGASGAYTAFGEAYKTVLAREGIALEVRQTKGSVENLGLLADTDSGVDVALVQGGVGNAASSPGLMGLGSLYFEPLWVFVRAEGQFEQLADLERMRLAIGAEGSGTRAVANLLLADNDLAPPKVQIEEVSGMAAADALRRLKRHYRLVILSNVHRAGFSASNRKLGVEFDAIYTAEDVGTYKPNLGNFHFMLERLQADLGITKDDVLHTAQSLFHDHVPATEIGLAKAWIDRQGLSKGGDWGATAEVAERPDMDFVFPTLVAMADARDAEG